MFYSILIVSDDTFKIPSSYPYSIKQLPHLTRFINGVAEGGEEANIIITDCFTDFDVLWDDQWVVTNASFETSLLGVYAVGSHVMSSKSPQEQVDFILKSLLNQ
ncbi:MAG: hypothetical protein WCT17_01295 [Bacilli bacterium]